MIIVLGVLICAIVAILVVRVKRSEVEEVEADTLEAAHKIQDLNNWNGETAKSPLLALEFRARGRFGKGDFQDFRNHYYEQADVGIHRLRQLGVLEERKFKIADPNAAAQFMNSVASRGSNVLWRVLNLGNAKWFGGFSQDFLWHVIADTNGTVTVVAKPGEMITWQRLIEGGSRTNEPIMGR
jgi:hypothetical protein